MGRFCHECGQENLEPKESLWHLISHFFKDVTHFDGKFFRSIKILIFKPGFLSKEYIAGKRATYLNPIRMYLFTSAVFFLIFFSFYTINENKLNIGTIIKGKTVEQITNMDSVTFSDFTKSLNNGEPMSRILFYKKYLDTTKNVGIILGPGKYHSRQQYDSLLQKGVKKHNWIERQLVYKKIELDQKYGANSRLMAVALVTRLMHSLPQMLFVLLPLFALILKLMYIRRKQFYYVDHIIFTIHFYIFIFLVMLVTFGLSKLRGLLHWEWLKWITALFILTIFFYFYKALRNFYKQRRAKTILKYIILVFLFSVTLIITFIIFAFFSMFNI